MLHSSTIATKLLDSITARWDQLQESIDIIYYLTLSKTAKLTDLMQVSDKKNFFGQKNKFYS